MIPTDGANRERGEPVIAETSPWPRRLIVSVALAMAAILVASAWLSYTSARAASQMVVRGRLEVLLEEIRARLRREDGPPDATRLHAFHAELEPRGVRYLAFVLPVHLGGAGPRSASAGTPAGPLPNLTDGPPLVITRAGDRTRVIARFPLRGPPGEPPGGPPPGGPPPGGPPPPRPGGPPVMIVEVETSIVADVSSAATRSLATAIVGALLLLGTALVASRWLALRDREVRARARVHHLASLGEMSAVLAHELRNPLASLKGNAQLLAESVTGTSRERADLVVEESIRLEQLTEGLLEFARTSTLTREPIELATYMRATAAELDPRITVDTTAAPARWSLDPDRFRQVLLNVMRNAVEASTGGVELRVRAARGALHVEVRDHGPGIPTAQLDAIFAPFHTTKAHGTGLGLAIARRIVELHGGTITASHAPGGGAMIAISLPGT